MNCQKHPNAGIVWLGEVDVCYGCYCEQFEYCPLCSRKWEDPLECKRGEEKIEEDKMTDFYDLWERAQKGGESRMKRWWECYIVGTDGGKHYHHTYYPYDTLESAQTEAERLARLTGKIVYLFEYVGKCQVETELLPIKWEIPK